VSKLLHIGISSSDALLKDHLMMDIDGPLYCCSGGGGSSSSALIVGTELCFKNL
jgi:hypothetical protein